MNGNLFEILLDYPFKRSTQLFGPLDERDERALDNCCAAIDMHEMFERISIKAHKSFLPHAAIFKVTRDILSVGGV